MKLEDSIIIIFKLTQTYKLQHLEYKYKLYLKSELLVNRTVGKTYLKIHNKITIVMKLYKNSNKDKFSE